MTNLVFNPTGSLKSSLAFNVFLKNFSELKGEEIIFINCDNYLGRACHVKENYNYNYYSHELSHKIICKICTQKQERMANKIGLEPIWIRDIKEYNTQSISKNVQKYNFVDFKYEGIDFGIYTTYDLIIKYKLQNVSEVDRYWNEYLENLSNAIRTFLEVKKILQQKKIKRLFVYNSLYSTNRAAVEAANKYGVQCFTVNKGYNVCERETSYVITRADKHPLLIHSNNKWQEEISIDKSGTVSRHIDIKMFGADSHSYSTRKKYANLDEIVNKLGMRNKFEKTCIVLLSSEDEYYATNLVGYYSASSTNLFENQIEWLKYIKKISQEMQNVLFVIRMHPREYPNSRSNSMSSNVDIINSIFLNGVGNVVINTPRDYISVYDLIQAADLVLNMSSSLGAEVAYLKKIVLGFATERLVAYPSAIHKTSSSLSEYGNDIQSYLWLDEPSKQKIIVKQHQNAIKWYLHLFETLPIRLEVQTITRRRLMFGNITKVIPKNIKKILSLVIFWSDRSYSTKSHIDEANVIKLDQILSE